MMRLFLGQCQRTVIQVVGTESLESLHCHQRCGVWGMFRKIRFSKRGARNVSSTLMRVLCRVIVDGTAARRMVSLGRR